MDVSAAGAVLYLGGHLTAASGVARHHLAAVRASGGGLEGWDPGADGVVGAFGS